MPIKLLVLSLLTISTVSISSVDIYEFKNKDQEQQYKTLIKELRCPKCQNQNLENSDSNIAQDIKRIIYQQIKNGQSDQQIRQYMIHRYGDFITYNPPIRPTTYILWYFPPILLIILVIGWIFYKKNPVTYPSTNDTLTPEEKHKLKQIMSKSSELRKSPSCQSQLDDKSHDI